MIYPITAFCFRIFIFISHLIGMASFFVVFSHFGHCEKYINKKTLAKNKIMILVVAIILTISRNVANVPMPVFKQWSYLGVIITLASHVIRYSLIYGYIPSNGFHFLGMVSVLIINMFITIVRLSILIGNRLDKSGISDIYYTGEFWDNIPKSFHNIFRDTKKIIHTNSNAPQSNFIAKLGLVTAIFSVCIAAGGAWENHNTNKELLRQADRNANASEISAAAATRSADASEAANRLAEQNIVATETANRLAERNIVATETANRLAERNIVATETATAALNDYNRLERFRLSLKEKELYFQQSKSPNIPDVSNKDDLDN